jgi:hypothetical protein
MNTSRRRVVLALGSTVLVPLMGATHSRKLQAAPIARSKHWAAAGSIARCVSRRSAPPQPAITASTATSMTSAPLAATPCCASTATRFANSKPSTKPNSAAPTRSTTPSSAIRCAHKFGRRKAGRPGRGIRSATNRSRAERSIRPDGARIRAAAAAHGKRDLSPRKNPDAASRKPAKSCSPHACRCRTPPLTPRRTQASNRSSPA